MDPITVSLIAIMASPATHNRDVRPLSSAGDSDYPGPPRHVFQFRSWRTLLWTLACVALFVLAQALVCETCTQMGFDAKQRLYLLRFPLLDLRAAVTLFVSFVALAVGREQFALGLRPYLSYSNINPTAEERKANKKSFRVVVRNEGTGLAVIHNVSYVLRLKDRAVESILQHETLVKRLKDDAGLEERRHYELPRFSAGATIGKDKERDVFTLIDRLVGDLAPLLALDIKLQYRGLLGDLYEKQIYCIPRPAYRRLTANTPAAVDEQKCGPS